MATAALTAAACALAWRDRSPLVPREGGLAATGDAWLFLVLLVAALGAYLAGLAVLHRVDLAPRAVVSLAAVVQLVPLGAPLLLSTDAWTYWAYGWIGAETGGNPYRDAPASFPASPALPEMGAAWRDTTTVYGPAFTMVSEAAARISGSSPDAAAWCFKALAAAAMLGAVLVVVRVAPRPALAGAFVGWNPVVAVHAAGGGHNDALVAGLAAAAAALAIRRRETLAGGAWALAGLVKWVPFAFLALAAVAARARGRPTGLVGAALVALAVSAPAVWLYGLEWLGALGPLADNLERTTSYALPSRLEEAGVPAEVAVGLAVAVLAAGLAWLARDALRGRARLGRAACLVLLTTPYLAVWYLAWAAVLAGVDDDRVARAGVVVLTAYLLPQTIPL